MAYKWCQEPKETLLKFSVEMRLPFGRKMLIVTYERCQGTEKKKHFLVQCESSI